MTQPTGNRISTVTAVVTAGATLAATVIAYLALAGSVHWWPFVEPSPPQPSPPQPTPSVSATLSWGPGVVLRVSNLVTDGLRMREDGNLAYLSKVARSFCKRDGCALPGTDLSTGDRVTAVCHREGAWTTNGDDVSAADDDNPGLAESTLWYGVRSRDGHFGYLSEVWIHPDDRGPHGLPRCP